MTKHLYFRPEYLREFVCDSSKCGENCCERPWVIDIDEETFKKYEQIRPVEKSREITSCFEYNADSGNYLLKIRPCPFLTDKKLCRLQLEYGGSFLSKTCATYPRRTFDFGKFFEQSLSLSCPVAAELVLLRDEPIKFEFVEVSEQGGNLKIDPVRAEGDLPEKMSEIQIAMISILQRRTLTINQRLIVLGFFLDRLDELISVGIPSAELEKLIAAYQSEEFLARQVPRMSASVQFDTEKFIELMLTIFEGTYPELNSAAHKKFLDALVKTLKIYPDKNNRVTVAEIAANYEALADKRKLFAARYSMFLENYLVNEVFSTGFPWKLKVRVPKNFAVLAAGYKYFELLIFAAEQQKLNSKGELLSLTERFVSASDHGETLKQKILSVVPADIFDSLETLLEP